MNFRQVILPAAQRDFDEAIEWYAQKKKGLGRRFANAVKQVLKGLRQLPNRHGIVLNDIRRAVVKGFPYVVYYRVKNDEVTIIAVFHASQDPGKWQSRI